LKDFTDALDKLSVIVPNPDSRKKKILKKESPLFDEKALIRQKENFTTKEFIIAAVGVINRGKPTLLNALIKAPIEKISYCGRQSFLHRY
jgi:ribosome biogenesis GTPase A